MVGITVVGERFAARVTLVVVGVTRILLVAGVETYVSAGSGPSGGRGGALVAKLVVYTLVSLLVVGVVVSYNTIVASRAVTDHAERLADGELDLTLESASLAPMRDTLVSELEATRAAKADAKTRREWAEQTRAEAETRLAAVRANEHLREKAEDYGVALRAVADGDLAVRVDRNVETVGTAIEAFEAVVEQVNELDAGFDEVTASARGQAGAIRETKAPVTDLTDITRVTDEESGENLNETRA
jgi:methyl-accepting chemotaxis protein